VARLLLAEKRLKQQEERAASLHTAKVKEATKIQANAVAELQAAIERVEKTQNAAAMVDADPTYEIPDVITASLRMKSSGSGRSMSSMTKSFNLKKKRNGKKQQGLQSQSIDEEEIYFVGMNLNTEDMRDDKDVDILTKKSREVVAQSKDGDNNLATDQEVAKEDMAQVDRHKRIRKHRHYSIFDQTIIEKGCGGPPKPNSLQAWIDWFMGEAECGDMCSCDSSFSEDEPSNFE